MNSPNAAPPTERGFWSYITIVFQGAFSDNAFKQLLVLYISMVIGAGEAARQGLYISVLTAIFPITYLMFSIYAGFFADKFSKRTMTLGVKVAEIGIMTGGLAVFGYAAYLWSGVDAGQAAGAVPGGAYTVFWLGVVVFFVMAAQSCFYHPNKYGIIPELVPERRLGWANGFVGMTTNLAIIFGLIFATEMFGLVKASGRFDLISLILVGLALIGLVLGFRIPKTARANPDRPLRLNMFPDLFRYLKRLVTDRTLLLTTLGLSYFWGLGAMVLTNVQVWGQNTLMLDEVDAGRLTWTLALGIGLGALAAGLISRKRLVVGLIPAGAVGIAVSATAIAVLGWFIPPDQAPSRLMLVANIAGLVLLAASAGLYSVPLNAILQSRTELKDRGGLLAATNYFTDGAMLLFVGIYQVSIAMLGFSPSEIFLIVAGTGIVGLLLVLFFTPDAWLRLLAAILTTTFYRIRILGRENVPEHGPALLVSNHVSWIDALILITTCPRPVRFLAAENFWQNWLLGRVLSATRCIPIAAQQKPKQMVRSLDRAAEALLDGEVVCIFPEGQLTRTGLMLPFRKGYQLILKSARRLAEARRAAGEPVPYDVDTIPIVPVCLDGVWGSVFSHERGRFFWKWPRHIPLRLRVFFGPAQPRGIDPVTLRRRIHDLSAEAMIAAKGDLPLLHQSLIRTARRFWGRFSMVDTRVGPLTMGRTLIGAILLARKLAPRWGDQQTVGVLLPPSVGAALVNYAAALSGRTIVNLNYTVGQQTMAGCAERAGLRTVVTARPFLEKTGLEAPVEAIYIEDLIGKPSLARALPAWLIARFAGERAVVRYCRPVRRPDPDMPATIIFSSGSTGEPKGIVLSDFNVAANVSQFLQGIHIHDHDRMLGVLPFFHSFGYTVSLWGSVIAPFGSVFHFSPLDVKTIGELCEKHGVTVMVSTPTFMRAYMRGISPDQLGGLNCVVSGAERLPDSVREGFRERFGVEPLQGYGTTECAPVVSTNVDDKRTPGLYQIGHKRGSIGHPLPGIAVRVLDAESSEELDTGQSGLLHVRGANVMQGYLDRPDLTEEAFHDGWYNTGDMAYLDEDGFIYITGRLSRFSKIGGEMVPHVTVEDRCREALGLDPDEGFVVSSAPDEQKGERLVVLHTLEDASRLDRLPEALAEQGMPNLWIPRRENMFRVDEIPVLGSGKLDLKRVEQMARELAG